MGVVSGSTGFGFESGEYFNKIQTLQKQTVSTVTDALATASTAAQFLTARHLESELAFQATVPTFLEGVGSLGKQVDQGGGSLGKQVGQPNASGQSPNNEKRIRLSPLISAVSQVLGPRGESNILSPLYMTGGLMFPYSPQITVSQDVTYQDIGLIHSNADFLAYQRTPAVNISITGKFTVQNQAEGAYTLACMHFLRTVSKMYFGGNDPNRGTPPPILVLNGYGSYMFNNLRVILKQHSYTYNEQMDTVLISTAGGTAKIPALFDISMTLVVQQTPRAHREDFDLNKFRTGELMRNAINSNKQGWI